MCRRDAGLVPPDASDHHVHFRFIDTSLYSIYILVNKIQPRFHVKTVLDLARQESALYYIFVGISALVFFQEEVIEGRERERASVGIGETQTHEQQTCSLRFAFFLTVSDRFVFLIQSVC